MQRDSRHQRHITRKQLHIDFAAAQNAGLAHRHGQDIVRADAARRIERDRDVARLNPEANGFANLVGDRRDEKLCAAECEHSQPLFGQLAGNAPLDNGAIPQRFSFG